MRVSYSNSLDTLFTSRDIVFVYNESVNRLISIVSRQVFDINV